MLHYKTFLSSKRKSLDFIQIHDVTVLFFISFPCFLALVISFALYLLWSRPHNLSEAHCRAADVKIGAGLNLCSIVLHCSLAMVDWLTYLPSTGRKEGEIEERFYALPPHGPSYFALASMQDPFFLQVHTNFWHHVAVGQGANSVQRMHICMACRLRGRSFFFISALFSAVS